MSIDVEALQREVDNLPLVVRGRSDWISRRAVQRLLIAYTARLVPAEDGSWEQMYADHVRLRNAIHEVATVASDPGPTEAHPHQCHFDCAWFTDQLLDRLRVPAEDEGRLREDGDGYRVQTWVLHHPSDIVVLKGHPQLGGRYCLTDGGDWPCAAVRAALAANPEPRP